MAPRFRARADSALKEILGDLKRDIARDLTSAMDEITQGLKSELREQVLAAGMGSRLAKTWQGKTYPDGGKASLEPAAYVKSTAPDLAESFDQAPIILPVNGRRFLAIPAPEAGVKHTSGQKYARITPALWQRETGVKLRFIPPRGRRPGLLVTDAYYRRQAVRYQRRKGFKPIVSMPLWKGQKWLVIFYLVPAAKMPKRLNVDMAAEHWANEVPSILERHMGGSR
jgi:hypothetical protein